MSSRGSEQNKLEQLLKQISKGLVIGDRCVIRRFCFSVALRLKRIIRLLILLKKTSQSSKRNFVAPTLSGGTEFSEQHKVVKNALLIRLPLADVPNPG